MDKYEIYRFLDNTILKQEASWEDIKKLCDISIKNETASVCIPPSFVKKVKEYVKSNMNVCTVIGFPNGYNTTAVKVFETKDAIFNGADEIDMVINIGWMCAGMYDEVLDEIKQIKEACNGKILKVIIETCLLNEEQKIKACELVTKAGADYIKTSTGFSKAGATIEDILLFKYNIGSNVKIKAAGGIPDIETAERFLDAGAARLGTSRILKAD